MFSAATKDNASNLKSDIRDTAASAKRDAEHALRDNGHDVEAYAHHAGRKARHYFESASEHMADTANMVQEEIKDNPLRATLVALGAGFILGALLRR